MESGRLKVIRQFLCGVVPAVFLVLVDAEPQLVRSDPAAAIPPPAAADLSPLSVAVGSAPLMFVENIGQFDPGARFQLVGGGSKVWLADDALWLSVVEPPRRTRPGPSTELPDRPEAEAARADDRKAAHVKVTFPGANPRPVIEPFNRLETHVSFFLGNDPDDWHADVPVWGGVRYVDLYPGIDLEMTSEQGAFLWRMVTRQPEAGGTVAISSESSLRQLRLRVEGANALESAAEGLRVNTAAGSVTLPLLRVVMPDGSTALTAAAQPEIDGKDVVAPFASTGPATGNVRALAGSRDLVYSTLLGGSGNEQVKGIAADGTGAAYVAGETSSTSFPGTSGAPDPTCGSCGDFNYDLFVAKLSPDGSRVVYATYLGGSKREYGGKIAVDASGAAYVTGYTESSDFPTRNPLQGSIKGTGCTDNNTKPPTPIPCPDAVVTKISASGSALLYSTYLGGTGSEGDLAIAVDSAGVVFLTGYTNSQDLPITAGAIQTTATTNGASSFVVKLSASGTTILYGTYFGGTNAAYAQGIAIDISGNVYVTGNTSSTDFPTTAGAYQQSRTVGRYSTDAFVVKISPFITATQHVLYGTYLGGTGDDYGWGIAVDANGAAYVTGPTFSSDFPTTAGALNRSCSYCNYDTYRHAGFVAKLNATGSALVYSTYLGAWGPRYGGDTSDIATDLFGNAYVVGWTDSSGFPTTSNAFRRNLAGDSDGFLVKLNNTGSALVYGTYLGGSGGESADAVAVDANGIAYAAGHTGSSDFPVSASAAYRTLAGSTDAFVTKLNLGGCLPIADPVPPRKSGRFRLNPTDLSTYTNPGNQLPLTQSLTLTVSGTTAVTWQATATTDCGGNWLSVSPTTGTAATSQSISLTVAIDARSLLPGNYSGLITLSSPDVGSESPVTATVPITVIDKPVVFIHGVMGSTLIDPTAGELWPALTATSAQQRTLNLYPNESHPAIVAGDAVRYVGGISWFNATTVYGPFLEMLASNGFREYQVNNTAARRTAAGCDVANQQSNRPNLFVYAYDFRQDNDVSARRLKEYVDCIERFYPGTRINLLTHSMGGLVARRYVLDFPENHQVEGMVTIAAPWLGAAKPLHVLQTGDFVQPIIRPGMMTFLANSWSGPLQLAASRAYFDLGGAPPLGVRPGPGLIRRYEDFVAEVDRRFGYGFFAAGSIGRSFHDFQTARGGQDDWHNDSTGVRYFHIYGQQTITNTIHQVAITSRASRLPDDTYVVTPTMQVRLGPGDGTVPTLSASRIGANGVSYNAQNARLRLFTGPNDDLVEHTGLTRNPDVHQAVLDYLKELNQPVGTLSLGTSTESQVSPAATSAAAYYVTVFSQEGLVVSDSLGNSTGPISGTLPGHVPEVSSFLLDSSSSMVVLPTTGVYSVTFRTLTEPLSIEIDAGTRVTVSRVIRYRDVSLPSGVTATLTLTPGGVAPLRYDADKNGSFERTITPTVAMTGTNLDAEPPAIAVVETAVGARKLITLTATDSGSGVARLLYSLDGRQFQAYTGTISVDPKQAAMLYAFADDKMENRSELLMYDLATARKTYLPVTFSAYRSGW